MSKVPVRRDQLRHKLVAFTAWLAQHGAEVGIPSNPYEVLRYRAYSGASRRALTHIIYAKESGLLTWTGGSLGHFKAFLEGWSMGGEKPAILAPAAPIESDSAKASARRRKRLFDRDGGNCWFCALALGADVTIEHLVPKSRGGGNDLANLVLAHGACNQAAANLSISEKVELRTKLRAAQPDTSPSRVGAGGVC